MIRPDGPAIVRLFNTNTNKAIDAHFEVEAPRRPPPHTSSGRPSRLQTTNGSVEVSLVDATNPVVFIAASTIGLIGDESVSDLETNPSALSLLDETRRAAAVAIGLCARPDDAPLSNPKIAIISIPCDYTTLSGASCRRPHTTLACA